MRCGALERHRLTWLFFQRRTDLFDGANKKVLHVAPELVFETLLSKQLGDGYLTADLSSPDAAIQMDITDICYPDESFDVIYCSHVLEHVPDDRKAMGELFRVLKPHGWAVLLAPIGGGGKTEEDLSITDPNERARLYGQHDHVRIYGRDYIDRLREAGFLVSETTASDLLAAEEVERMGITSAAGEIFYCVKG